MSVDDLLQYLKATFGSVVVVILLDLLLDPVSRTFTPVFFILYAVYLFLGLAATRSSFKILDQLSLQKGGSPEERVVIYGAGDAGELALRWIHMNPQLGFRPIGFLDDDPYHRAPDPRCRDPGWDRPP